MTEPKAVVIREFMPGGGDGAAFRAMNEEWITRYWPLEAKDVATLGDPNGTILDKGGRILMVEAEGQAVGCVALIPMSDGVVELSKMAVRPAMRGQGVGRRLLQRAIVEARTMGARRLFLGSSTKLADAVHLYEAAGFEHVPAGQLPEMPYARADVFMQMDLGGGGIPG